MSDTRTNMTNKEITEMMEKIKNNVMKRNQIFPSQDISKSDETIDLKTAISLDQDLIFINKNYNLQNVPYIITSHRPFFGYFFIKARELVNSEIKRYIDPIFFLQSIFNGTLVRITGELKNLITLNQNQITHIKQMSSDHQTSIAALNDQITHIKQMSSDHQTLIAALNDQITHIKQMSSDHQTLIAALNDQITHIKQMSSDHQTSIAALNDQITHIKQMSSDHQTSIAAMNDQLSIVTSEKDQFKSDIIHSINERCDKYDTYLKSVDITKWSRLYSKNIVEKDLEDNIQYHSYFIDLIRKYAKLSAKSKIPKLIEIGLGNGTMSIFFSRNELFDVYGIDNDIDVLRYCINNSKQLGGYVKFLLLDAFNLDILKKKDFDVAFSQGTLEHFDNESIIKLLLKQLEIANFVVFSIPSINWATREIGNERKMTLDEWRTLLHEGGFNIVTLEYYKDDLHIVGIIS